MFLSRTAANLYKTNEILRKQSRTTKNHMNYKRFGVVPRQTYVKHIKYKENQVVSPKTLGIIRVLESYRGKPM